MNPILSMTNKSLSTVQGEYTRRIGGDLLNSEAKLIPPSRIGLSAHPEEEGGGKKQYRMDHRSTQTCLEIVGKSMKFLTVNMLNLNLVQITLAQNKIRSLPKEICQL